MTTEAIPNTNTAASLASIGYGAAFSIGTGIVPASASFTQILEVTDVDWSGITVGAEEVTNLGSPSATKEFIPGLADSGKLTVEGNYVGDATQESLLTSIQARTVQCFEVQALVNGKTKTLTVQCVGFLTKFAPSGKIEAGKAVKYSVEVQITGPIILTLV